MTQISLSRSEIEALSLKAARGAGYDWGLAEEAAFCAGTLAAIGIDGATALSDLCTQGPAVQPVKHGDSWSSDRPMCPIRLGASLMDHAPMMAKDTTIKIGPIQSPLLLLPFLTQVSQILGHAITAVNDTDKLVISAQLPPPDQCRSFDHWSASGIRIAKTTANAPAATPQATAFPAATIAALEALAMNTTVPATEASRASGAGAGLSDND